jgi:hypothetical protein
MKNAPAYRAIVMFGGVMLLLLAATAMLGH